MDQKYIDICENNGWAVRDIGNGTVQIAKKSKAGEDMTLILASDDFVAALNDYINELKHAGNSASQEGIFAGNAAIAESLSEMEALLKAAATA